MKRLFMKKNRTHRIDRTQVTELGRAVLMGTILFFLACLIVPAFGVLSALISLNLIALIVGYIYRPRLSITVSYPRRVMAGESLCLRYVITNLSPISAYNLTIGFDPLPAGLRLLDKNKTISVLRPDEGIEVLIHVTTERRGRYLLPAPVCYSSFPLNLLQFSVPYAHEQPLLVIPFFHQLDIERFFTEATLLNDESKSGMISGLCPEYIGNRPFIPGDSRRQIDYRAWARLATPAVKEFHEAFQSRVAFVLDTAVSLIQRQAYLGPIMELEAAVSLCASLAYSLDKDCQIDWLITADTSESLYREAHVKRCDLIHDILMDVQPSEKPPPQERMRALMDRFMGMSEVFFILLHWTPDYQKWIQMAQRAGCHVEVIVIQTDKDPNLKLLPYSEQATIHIVDAAYILQKRMMSL